MQYINFKEIKVSLKITPGQGFQRNTKLWGSVLCCVLKISCNQEDFGTQCFFIVSQHEQKQPQSSFYNWKQTTGTQLQIPNVLICSTLLYSIHNIAAIFDNALQSTRGYPISRIVSVFHQHILKFLEGMLVAAEDKEESLLTSLSCFSNPHDLSGTAPANCSRGDVSEEVKAARKIQLLN